MDGGGRGVSRRAAHLARIKLLVLGVLVGADWVSHHLRVGVDAGVAGGEEVLHGADVVDGHVQDVDLGQLLALAAPGEHRVRDLMGRSAMRLSVGGVKLNQIQQIYSYMVWVEQLLR